MASKHPDIPQLSIEEKCGPTTLQRTHLTKKEKRKQLQDEKQKKVSRFIFLILFKKESKNNSLKETEYHLNLTSAESEHEKNQLYSILKKREHENGYLVISFVEQPSGNNYFCSKGIKIENVDMLHVHIQLHSNPQEYIQLKSLNKAVNANTIQISYTKQELESLNSENPELDMIPFTIQCCVEDDYAITTTFEASLTGCDNKGIELGVVTVKYPFESTTDKPNELLHLGKDNPETNAKAAVLELLKAIKKEDINKFTDVVKILKMDKEIVVELRPNMLLREVVHNMVCYQPNGIEKLANALKDKGNLDIADKIITLLNQTNHNE